MASFFPARPAPSRWNHVEQVLCNRWRNVADFSGTGTTASGVWRPCIPRTPFRPVNYNYHLSFIIYYYYYCNRWIAPIIPSAASGSIAWRFRRYKIKNIKKIRCRVTDHFFSPIALQYNLYIKGYLFSFLFTCFVLRFTFQTVLHSDSPIFKCL